MNPSRPSGHPAQVYTDGVGGVESGPGGWAWVIPGGPSASGGAAQTTKNRMELMAIHQALQSTPGPVEVVCRSNYVVGCFRDRWWEGWIRRGWRNSDKKAIPNRDLWTRIIEQVQARHITFLRTAPGISNAAHDQANRLAVEASDSQETVQEQSLF